LACEPDLLIADEPTTALDVTIQGQILDLIADLVAERGMSMILISHDLGVIAENVQRMMVMYGGTVVENGDIETRLASKQTHSRKEAAMRERNNFVYLRDELPNRGDLCRRGNGNVRVGSARLDGAHRRNADDGIAQPIARANQNAKRL